MLDFAGIFLCSLEIFLLPFDDMSGVGGTHSDGFPRKKSHMIRGPPSSLSDLSNAANATLFV